MASPLDQDQDKDFFLLWNHCRRRTKNTPAKAKVIQSRKKKYPPSLKWGEKKNHANYLKSHTAALRANFPQTVYIHILWRKSPPVKSKKKRAGAFTWKKTETVHNTRRLNTEKYLHILTGILPKCFIDNFSSFPLHFRFKHCFKSLDS